MGGGGTSTTEVHTYHYYRIKLAHSNIIPSEPIYCYDAVGNLVYTVPPYSEWMNYGTGVASIPGNEQNTVLLRIAAVKIIPLTEGREQNVLVENISTATYWVSYSTNDVIIDYDMVEFRIAKTIVRNPNQVTVQATFEYFAVVTAIKDIGSVIDGRWDTQVQTIFYAEPPMGYNYAIIDLGAIYNIQAVDIIAGFFRPEDDPNFKIDIDMRFTIQYSLNGSDYYDISDETNNMRLGGGESISLEEDDLGVDFSTRYIKIILEKIKKIEYQKGVWVVAFSEVSAYEDIVLKSESQLIRTTKLTQIVDIDENAASGETYTIHVTSTTGFTTPSFGGSSTAYVNEDMFIYTGLTSTSFTGCSGLNEDHAVDERVTTVLTDDTHIYDDDNLLGKLGDRVYKLMKVNSESLYTQTEGDRISKAYLKEFYKDHSKIEINVAYSPFLQVGQTIKLVDPYNNVSTNYFIETVSDNKGGYTLVLAKYPA